MRPPYRACAWTGLMRATSDVRRAGRLESLPSTADSRPWVDSLSLATVHLDFRTRGEPLCPVAIPQHESEFTAGCRSATAQMSCIGGRHNAWRRLEQDVGLIASTSILRPQLADHMGREPHHAMATGSSHICAAHHASLLTATTEDRLGKCTEARRPRWRATFSHTRNAAVPRRAGATLQS